MCKKTYRAVIALGNQSLVALGVDLEDRRLLAVETGLSAWQGGQKSYCNSAKCWVMHGGQKWTGSLLLGRRMQMHDDTSDVEVMR